MPDNYTMFLAKIEIPLEIFILLIVVSGGIWLIVVIVENTRTPKSPTSRQNARNSSVVGHEVYQIAALVVIADGKVEESEIAAAVQIGRRLLPNFDEQTFRKMCSGSTEIGEWKSKIRNLGSKIQQKDKEVLLKYLVAISASDGEIDEKEIEIINQVADVLGLEMPT